MGKKVLKLRKQVKSRTESAQSRPVDYSSQMEILAIELSLAGGQVLKDSFGFTPEKVADWMDKTLTVAKLNRDTMLSKIVEGIDEG